jgi:hypothetical protein
MSDSTSYRLSALAEADPTPSRSTPKGRSRITPGDGLLDPVALVALTVLILNDQFLKAAWPGAVTGKLSDVAGLIVAPLALQAAWEVVSWAGGRWNGPSPRVLALTIGLVGFGFVAIQLPGPGVEAYRLGLAILQWPFAALAAIVAGDGLPPARPVAARADIADLLALPALGVAWWIGRQRSDRALGDIGFFDC